MKKIILLIGLGLGSTTLFAQSIEQGKQELYYEKYQTAAKTLETVVRQKPDEGEAWYSLAYAYLHHDQVEKAKEALLQAPASVQSNPFYKAALGYVLLSENKKDSANIYFSQALNDTKEKDPAILSAVAQAEIEAKEGNATNAIQLLDKAIKRDKRNATLYALKGDAYRKLDNGSEAFKAYQEALSKDDKLAVALYQIGNIFVTQKNEEVYLQNFQKAIDADKNFAPAYYAMYLHYFYKDPAKAKTYFDQYVALSEPSIKNDYAFTDLLYLNKQYKQAMDQAEKIKVKAGEKLQPRIYKLMAYSTAGLGDTAKAIDFMQQYFAKEADSNFIAKDFESMANFFRAKKNNDSALAYLEKMVGVEKDSTVLFDHYKTLASLSHDLKNYSAEAKWLGKYYTGNSKASNVDLFNWALAHYRAEEYANADSLFGIYVKDHPEQGFGYYWQARSNAMLDKEMKDGLAVPYYQKLIEINQNDTASANYKKWMIEAYGYLAAYNANTKKDYTQAINYFQKLLEVDPENADAKKYISLLEKRGTANNNQDN